MDGPAKQASLGQLLTLEDVGSFFQGACPAALSTHRIANGMTHPRLYANSPPVPVNLKDRDAFHITIEEYLMALASMTEELSRLAVNAVTLGDYEMAVTISHFVKSVHAGFQLLNLKNDFLRRKVDGIKYSVKKVEDVVYDLSLRNLIPAAARDDQPK